MNRVTRQHQDLNSLISPSNKYFNQKGIEFSRCFIKEIKSNLFENKKYVKILGIITEIKKKSKYIEFTIDDSSGIIRAIYWGCRSEFECLKLTNNFYSNFPCFGILVEARGIVENYNNKTQLKIFNLNTVSENNYESLWWINIYNQKSSEMMVKNTSISVNLEKNVASIPNQTFNTIGLMDDSGNIKQNIKHVELDDVCICKKVPFSSENIPISLSKFNLITRIVASSLLRSISIQHSESDEIGEDYISFSINKLLTSTNEVLNILTVIPVSHYIFFEYIKH